MTWYFLLIALNYSSFTPLLNAEEKDSSEVHEAVSFEPLWKTDDQILFYLT